MSFEAEPIWMVCEVCNLPLNSFEPADGGPLVYQHPLRPDTVYVHVPVPIPRHKATHVVMECDFCSSPEVAWIYPTSEPLSNTLAIETARTVEYDHDTHTMIHPFTGAQTSHTISPR